MLVSISIVRYRTLFIPFAILAMAIHRIPLYFNKGCRFWKLMGCGKNGSFDLQPDWQQWALLAVWNSQEDFNRFNESSFIAWWWKQFTQEHWTLLSVPIASHGKWDGKEPFKLDKYETNYTGPVAVLTRATIRLNKLPQFWANVEPVAEIMTKAKGFITSVGIGEAPFFRQATLSVWKDMESMKAFAYGSAEHAEVIRKTRKLDWYSEELFARFRLLSGSGTNKGIDPINEIQQDLLKAKQ
jgi:heme-degrading monooxygenase HmoA